MKDNSRGSDSSGLGITITKYLVESMHVDIDKEWTIFRIKFLVSGY